MRVYIQLLSGIVASTALLHGCSHSAGAPSDQALRDAPVAARASADARFAALAARFVDEFPALSPVTATALGDHRYDHLLDDISAAARQREHAFAARYLAELAALDWSALSPANQIDAELLRHQLEYANWSREVLQDWAWDPLIYASMAGGALYSLMAREFAPLEQRLVAATGRLEQMPRLFGQVRATLQPARVPRIHAETAARQHAGVTSIIDNLIEPQMDVLDASARQRLVAAIASAKAAAAEHQAWLDNELVPNANGEFRIGAGLFDQKLAFALHSPLDRAEIRRRAEREYVDVRRQMYAIARQLVAPDAPPEPTPERQQAVIEAGLELAYAQLPGRDEIVAVAERSLAQATRFVREKNLVEVPDDPVEIIIMPEFQRGVAIAYCDPPGPLDRGQKTFYAVSPLPESWSDEQVRSFLREYNLLSIHDLTIHEAMPGHFLQLALSNRYPSVLRAMLYSGPFVEGWAVYAERVMIDAGYLDGDPLMRLVNLKWYLRAVVNAIIDQAIHVDGMQRDAAMDLMTRGAFQEEREAAGKWTRAQLSISVKCAI